MASCLPHRPLSSSVVAGRGRRVRMARELLHRGEVAYSVQEVPDEGLAEVVGRDLLDLGLPVASLDQRARSSSIPRRRGAPASTRPSRPSHASSGRSLLGRRPRRERAARRAGSTVREEGAFRARAPRQKPSRAPRRSSVPGASSSSVRPSWPRASCWQWQGRRSRRACHGWPPSAGSPASTTGNPRRRLLRPKRGGRWSRGRRASYAWSRARA